MSIKSNALFQIPDWMENDRTKSKHHVRPNVDLRPSVIPVNKRNVKSSTTNAGKVNLVGHHDYSKPQPGSNAKLIAGNFDRQKVEKTSKNIRKVNKNSSSSTTKMRIRRYSNTLSAGGRPQDESESNGLHFSQKRSSSGKFPRKHQQSPESEDVNTADDDDDLDSDSGILFINHHTTGSGVENTTCSGRISPTNLMQCCGTSTPEFVFEINLHAQGLQKIENLDKFTRLRTLDLSCNNISEIENLQHNKELRELKLYDNRIDGVTGLESLGDLCHLQLQHNRISRIGNGLACQKKLTILRIDSNQLEVVEARELAPLSALVSLDVSSNRLTDITSVNSLPLLEELNASHNRLETVADIGRCKRLKEVNVSSNQLRDINGLCGMHSIMMLSVSGNLLTNNSLKTLGKLQSLQYLDVSGNRLTNLAMIPSQFPSLEVLQASRNKLEDSEKLNCLQRCPALTELVLDGNPLCLDEDRYRRLRQDLASWCGSLEMLDGVHIRRPKGAASHMPIMRPMSASSALSTRQVENQLKLVEETLSSFQVNLTSSFADLRSSMSYLPSEVSKKEENTSTPSPNQGSTSRSITPQSPVLSSPRPANRCGSRQRIAEAQAYASTHF